MLYFLLGNIIFHKDHLYHLWTESAKREVDKSSKKQSVVLSVFLTIWHCILSAALLQTVVLAILHTGLKEKANSHVRNF